MKAGIKMDNLIAEKLTGWTRGALLDVPPYSTDISEAWKVIESASKLSSSSLSKLPFGFTVSRKAGPDSDKVSVTISEVDSPLPANTHNLFTIVGDSAPHALCLAALKTVGIEF